MTTAIFQLFCKAHISDLWYFDGNHVYTRSVTQRNKAIYIHNNHHGFNLEIRWRLFDKVVKELKFNFKLVDMYVTDENVNNFPKYENKFKKKWI